MRIESRRGDAGFTREDFEARNRHYGDFCALGEALGGADANAHAGKAPGTVHDDDCIEQPKLQGGTAQKIGDGGDERGRVGASG